MRDNLKEQYALIAISRDASAVWVKGLNHLDNLDNEEFSHYWALLHIWFRVYESAFYHEQVAVLDIKQYVSTNRISVD